jgi:hypothetical protein
VALFGSAKVPVQVMVAAEALCEYPTTQALAADIAANAINFLVLRMIFSCRESLR